MPTPKPEASQPPAICENCDLPLPGGCRHFYGYEDKCAVGPRTDIPWRIGLAIWKDLTDRRGIKHELQNCDEDIQVEIVETMGRLAMEEMARG